MSITKLYIFKKDTDASASIRGVEYQLLQTMKEWVQNYLDRKGDIVYSEFDDDIAIYNSVAATVRFKQIKSYSEKFSFNNKEVRKTLLNFFTLYASPSYLQHELEFIFERNAGVISGTNEDNNFLSKWAEAEKAGLTDSDLAFIFPKIKELILHELDERASKETENINAQIARLQEQKPAGFSKRIEKLMADQASVTKAIEYLKQVNDDTYIDFIKRIKWTFHDKSPADAILDLTGQLNSLSISCLSILVFIEFQ